MYIIYDTETTSFPNPNYSAKHPAQSRVIQLAALVLDKDFVETDSLYSFVKPTGWKISEGAFKAHGIAIQKCEELGRPIEDIIIEFEELRSGCEYEIGHNLEFDSQMVHIEKQRMDIKSFCHSQICTMDLMTNICQLPHKGHRNRFGNKFKWPKLAEAYEYCFHESLQGAHDSMNDVRATARIFKWLVDNGHLELNTVV